MQQTPISRISYSLFTCLCVNLKQVVHFNFLTAYLIAISFSLLIFLSILFFPYAHFPQHSLQTKLTIALFLQIWNMSKYRISLTAKISNIHMRWNENSIINWFTFFTVASKEIGDKDGTHIFGFIYIVMFDGVPTLGSPIWVDGTCTVEYGVVHPRHMVRHYYSR